MPFQELLGGGDIIFVPVLIIRDYQTENYKAATGNYKLVFL